MPDKLYEKTLRGLFWQFTEKFGTQIISFIVSLVMARLLTPDDYGILGIISVFITIALVFAQSGMGQALIQKKDTDEDDYFTVMVFSIAVAIVGYIILFALAGFIASIYNEPILKPVIRVLGITIIIGASSSVLQARVQKAMDFKKLFYANFTGAVLSAPIGIYVAYIGMGVWALAVSQIINQTASCIVLIISTKYKMHGKFSHQKMKSLFSYGWKLLFSTLLDTFYDNIYSLIIGKLYSPRQLGYYSRGGQFPVFIVQNANAAIDGVMMPVMSSLQDNTKRLKSALRRSVSLSCYVIFPAMAGLAAAAHPLILVLLGDKWLPAVPFLRFCCFMYALWPIHTSNLQAIKALGRSDIFLKLEIIKKIIGFAILIASIPFGIYAIMIGICITDLIGCVVNAMPNKRLVGYKIRELICDTIPAFIMSMLMFTVVYCIGFIALNPILLLILQGTIGIIIYLLLSLITKSSSFKYITNTINHAYLRRI